MWGYIGSLDWIGVSKAILEFIRFQEKKHIQLSIIMKEFASMRVFLQVTREPV